MDNPWLDRTLVLIPQLDIAPIKPPTSRRAAAISAAPAERMTLRERKKVEHSPPASGKTAVRHTTPIQKPVTQANIRSPTVVKQELDHTESTVVAVSINSDSVDVEQKKARKVILHVKPPSERDN